MLLLPVSAASTAAFVTLCQSSVLFQNGRDGMRWTLLLPNNPSLFPHLGDKDIAALLPLFKLVRQDSSGLCWLHQKGHLGYAGFCGSGKSESMVCCFVGFCVELRELPTAFCAQACFN